MTVEAFTPSPVYLVAGAGPYQVTHPYRANTLRVAVWRNGVRAELAPSEYLVSPAFAEVSGTLTLTAAAAATHAGAQLYITRDTVPEQGWEGTSSRERGLEAQLDWITQGVQDVEQTAGRSLRAPLGDTTNLELPPALDRAQRVLMFDATGRPTVGAVTATEVPVSLYAQQLLTSSDPASARDVLEIPPPPARFDVRQYGAIGDGATNDAAAVQAAINAAIAAGGGVVLFPEGEFAIDGASLVISVSDDSPVALVGAGSYMTTLRFRGSFTNGIVFTSTTTAPNQHPEFTVAGMSIRTSRLNAGTAVRATWANGLNIERAFRMTDVVMGQYIKAISDSGADFGYWSRGVHLTNARNSYLSNVYFYGEMNLSPQTGDAFLLDGDTVFVGFDNILVLEATTGIRALSPVEGVKVVNSSIVGARNGIFFDGGAGAEPELCVVNCDFNCANVGVWTINIQGVAISNSFFFANSWLDSGSWPEWTGVLLQGANGAYATITGNNFTKEIERTGDTTTGIDCNAGGYYAIDGNRFYSISPGNLMTFGVQVRAGVTDVRVGASNLFRNVSSPFSNLGARSIRDQAAQSGTATVATGATITFPQAFRESARVVAVHGGVNSAINVTVSGASATGFVVHHNGGGPVVIEWIAVGN